MTKDMTNGSPMKLILGFSIPLLFGYLFQQFYNLVDTLIVGRFLGVDALAAVGSTGSLNFLIIGFCMGVCNGFAIPLAHKFGAGDYRGLRAFMVNAIYLSAIFAVVMTAVTVVFCRPILELMRTPDNIIDGAYLYIVIIFAGIPATYLYNLISAIIRSMGDSKTPVVFLVISSVMNIALDLVFIINLHLGVAGASLATVISQGVSAILVTRSLMKSYGILKLELRAIRFHGALLKSELKIGLPGGIQSFGYSISNIIIQAVINNFGTDTAAAWAAYGKLDAIFWTVCGSFGIAITTFSGQNFGARKFDRVKKSVRVCLAMALTVCGSLIVFLMIFCRPLYHIFTTDQAVVDIGVYMLRLITPSYVIFIFVEIFSGALRGIGDVLIPSTITLGGVLLVRLTWILFVTPMTGELSTLLYSYPLAWGATALLLIPYYFHRRKQVLKE